MREREGVAKGDEGRGLFSGEDAGELGGSEDIAFWGFGGRGGVQRGLEKGVNLRGEVDRGFGCGSTDSGGFGRYVDHFGLVGGIEMG